MSVATRPTAVPLHRQHIGRHPSSSTRTSTNKPMPSSPPHPHAHGFHRRRLASPISPLSTTYNTQSLNKTKEEVIAACNRDVQWSFEEEYGRIIEKFMKDSEVNIGSYFLAYVFRKVVCLRRK